MKHYKTITRPAVPERTERIGDYIACDLCGAKGRDEWDCTEWRAQRYDTDRTHIWRKYGTDYGDDGGDGQVVEVHLCPECFDGKLLPWIREQGGTPTEDRWSTY